MKSLTKYCFITLFFSFHCFVYGQFNTLIPIQPKKTENLPIVEKTDGTKDLKQKSDKKFWKAIFNTTSKVDLKKELDSLKTMIKETSEKNDKKLRMQKIRDSLILQLQSQVIINEQKRTTSITRNEYENETGEFKFSKIAMPVSRPISLTSPYGMRQHPIVGTARIHNGIDLKAHYENVCAVMDGMVIATGWDPNGGGNYIKVKHYNRFETSYLHLSEIYYRTGDPVKAGFIIAKSGNSGNSTGAHLHFAVRENGKYINPIRFLNDLIEADHWLVASYQN
ncbi:M23 family metallopeptidase [Epilithonimonas mollis]|uniref:Murein DD-endopeptidase MepM and murein hydrolase activator NlpD, contain LysM domain n=1 Tax=Epilithonimonas mollis TaxID=216903 RepID=A0A1M6UWA2_9FLAO|nr:M23 family metallopeptidase [Epilithonimonas mollis]SHK73421.1 Murein DD-endopeptidase MepM and murein hydrolase activator NlpD, contain LysM domain [Epilithonimonas mollis]